MINLIKGVPISSHDIVDAMTSEPPQFIATKDSKVEFARSFPNMVYTLWGYVCTYRAFPSQHDFVSYYKLVHHKALIGYDEAAVTARLLRSYPSLAREVHFFQLVRESNVFESVSYCAYDDVVDGIDFTASLAGNEYNISCYVATKRSLMFRHRKAYRRDKPIINSIEMPLNLSQGEQIGKWIIFSQKHVDVLQNKIINYAWKQFQQHPLELLSC